LASGWFRAPELFPDALSGFLFESHWVYWITLLALGGILSFLRPAALGKYARPSGLILIVLAILWALAAHFVDTPAERLAAAHARILAAASAKEAQPIMDLLADDFRFGTADRAAMLPMLEAAFRLVRPAGNTQRFYEADIIGHDAETRINILTTLDAGASGMPAGPYLTKWRLRWRDVAGQDWRLVTVLHWYTSDATGDHEMPLEIPIGP